MTYVGLDELMLSDDDYNAVVKWNDIVAAGAEQKISTDEVVAALGAIGGRHQDVRKRLTQKAAARLAILENIRTQRSSERSISAGNR